MTAPQLIVTVAKPLDARPVTVYTLHCSICGKTHEGEYADATWWSEGQVRNLGRYELEGWVADLGMSDPDMNGYPLVCPSCYAVAFCGDCGGDIHVWEPYEYDPADKVHIHVACCEGEHEHPVVTCKDCRGTSECPVCQGGRLSVTAIDCDGCHLTGRCSACSVAVS